MNNRVIIIFDHDLIGYPPTLTLINVLLSLKKKVVVVGVYSDQYGKEKLIKEGVQFVDLDCIPNFKQPNFLKRQISIFINLIKFKIKVHRILDSLKLESSDLIWFLYSGHAALIHNELKKYRYYVQFYEFVDASPQGVLKVICPKFNPGLFLRDAQKVIHCEYNRAAIMNGYYGVEGKLNILPNKPEIDDELLKEVPEDLQKEYFQIKELIGNKKAIIYQGMFNSKERRLDEFCEAAKMLPEDYLFIAMGGGHDWETLKDKYPSEKVLFIPFVKPPYHLLYTQLAWAGVLSYFPVNTSLQDVINPLYCAPNKIFEYAKFAKPMISNDIPALRQIFEKYNCGRIIEDPITAEGIAREIQNISDHYTELCEGAKRYYDSVDVKSIISDLLS